MIHARINRYSRISMSEVYGKAFRALRDWGLLQKYDAQSNILPINLLPDMYNFLPEVNWVRKYPGSPAEQGRFTKYLYSVNTFFIYSC